MQQLTKNEIFWFVGLLMQSDVYIGWGWAKYCDLSVASRYSTCKTDWSVILWATDKLQYFARTEFNNCFIILL
jgi:hypothetical protein